MNIRNDGDVNLNMRVGRRCQLHYGFMFDNVINGRGYVDMTESEDTIYFARRDVKQLKTAFRPPIHLQIMQV